MTHVRWPRDMRGGSTFHGAGLATEIALQQVPARIPGTQIVGFGPARNPDPQLNPHQALVLRGGRVLVALERAQLLVDVRVHEVGDVVPAPYLRQHVVPLVLRTHDGSIRYGLVAGCGMSLCLLGSRRAVNSIGPVSRPRRS